MRHFTIAVLFAVLALGSMAAPAQARKTPEQKEWLARQKAQPLTFTLPDAEAGPAWLRAKVWIAANAKAPIQIADENLIQTQTGFGGVELDSRPQLTITRVQLATGDWTFAVSGQGFGPGPSFKEDSLQALAFHVASGDPYPGDN